jgi:hypothetical protein
MLKVTKSSNKNELQETNQLNLIKNSSRKLAKCFEQKFSKITLSQKQILTKIEQSGTKQMSKLLR